ncbi:ShlB/FhaC/HecB family hemolysin secretion/activation protein [Agaribacterium sp. ZY112]|uniref:ShlB/FhaC/HecB family hemolysin secretion/activation protein n=1 Tax=Agaribacterium sp. ZY112 TaxID=3233574 RepID=UPI0035248D47
MSQEFINRKCLQRSLLSSAIALVVSAGLSSAAAAQSLRDVFQQDTPTQTPDVTEEYFERTVIDQNAPKLDTTIPDAEQRVGGPRILVRKFEFERLEEFPEAGISKEQVEAEAEKLRIKYMKEDQMLAGGFTEAELVELAEYLNEVGAQTNADDITYEDMQLLIDIVRQQNNNRGLSYADLEEVTNELTRYYREQGLFLAKVQIPPQDVEEGVLVLSVMEGRLGQVAVENNRKYQLKTLEKPFVDDLGGLVSHDQVEESLYLLNDLPGLNVAGYFSAGDKPGETKLNLNVREEDAWRLTVRADNHGSTFTGDKRLFTTVDWYNPIGIGDSLTVGYLRSEDIEGRNLAENEAKSDLGQFKYTLPLFSLRTRVGVSADYNEFTIVDEGDEQGINAAGLEGTNSTYALFLDHQFRRSRDFNLSSGFAFTDKESKVRASNLPDESPLNTGDHVLGGEVNFYIDGLGETVRMLNLASVKLQYGAHQNETAEGRGDEFVKLSLDSNSLFFMPLPFTDASSRIILRSHLQYTDKSLPAFEQFSIGGANAARAYSSRDFSADSAALLSAEWYPDLPAWPLFAGKNFNDVFQIGLLADGSYGVANGGYIPTGSAEEKEDDWASLTDVGLVLKLNWGEHFAGKVSWAKPMVSNSNLDTVAEDAEDNRIYADFSFTY